MIDFIQQQTQVDAQANSNNSRSSLKSSLSGSGIPPIPPNYSHSASTPSLSHSASSSNMHRSIADAASIRIEHMVRSNSKGSLSSMHGEKDKVRGRDGLLDADEGPVGIEDEDGESAEEEKVMHINLSSAVLNPNSLPESVKLHSHGKKFSCGCRGHFLLFHSLTDSTEFRRHSAQGRRRSCGGRGGVLLSHSAPEQRQQS